MKKAGIKKIHIAIILLSTFMSTSVFATCNWNNCFSTIKTMRTDAPTGKVYIEVDGDASPLLCELEADRYITLSPTTGNGAEATEVLGYSETYSNLLAAYHGDSLIRIRPTTLTPTQDLSGTTRPSCVIWYVVLERPEK